VGKGQLPPGRGWETRGQPRATAPAEFPSGSDLIFNGLGA